MDKLGGLIGLAVDAIPAGYTNSTQIKLWVNWLKSQPVRKSKTG